jgi:hypothetical protein
MSGSADAQLVNTAKTKSSSTASDLTGAVRGVLELLVIGVL